MGQHCSEGIAMLPFSLEEMTQLLIRALREGNLADRLLCDVQLQLIATHAISPRCFERCYLQALQPQHFVVISEVSNHLIYRVM